MKTSGKMKALSFSEFVLFAALFFVGVFHVYLSCALSVVLLIRLLICFHKKGELTFRTDTTMIFISVLVLSYAIVSLWAIDSGMAVFGFFKFLPLFLFLLSLMQEEGGKERIISHLPYLVTVMTVISVICMHIPPLTPYFAVSGRLSGFVQYPNSFAIILLVAELILITKEKPLIWDYICISVLFFGILYTGSRTVFILAGISNLAALLFNKNKKVRFFTLGCIGAGILCVLSYCLIIGDFYVLTRFLKISANQSTFVGRLLYARDALPVILRHPFGIGYMGYYFIQPSIQSGVYSVMFAHNDLIQFLIDVGWIPSAFFLFAIGKTLFHKNVQTRDKLILLTIFLHSLFDFDLQYIAIFMMMLLFMNTGDGKKIVLKKNSILLPSAGVLLVCLCLYFGVADGLNRFQFHKEAVMLYSKNTLSQIEMIKQAKETSEAEQIADRILEQNSYVALAYSIKARSAYEKGDFQNVIKYKNQCFQIAHFSHAEYWEYGNMLVNGVKLYEKAGDTASAAYCRKELMSLIRLVRGQKDRLSSLGEKIDQQPRIYFPSSLQEEFDALGVRA